MISKMDREGQFNSILDSAEGDADSLLFAARQIERRDADLSANLHLLAQLRQTAPSRAEIDKARLRVGQRLTRDIFADPDDVGAQERALRQLRLSEPPETAVYPAISMRDATSAPTPSASPTPTLAYPKRTFTRRRVIMGTAAAAALFLALSAGLTAASAQSLPESPLYNVKLAEESILLAFPQSDNTRAQTLSMIAERRLMEAQAEANAHHDSEATTLLSQYNGDMRQLIMLAASVNQQHGDSSAITAQIAQVIQTQQTIQLAAAAQGDSTFTQALSDSAATVSVTLKKQNVTLPGANGNAGQNNGKGHGGVSSATPTIGPTPTPPGSSGSHSHGHGNGNGIGNGH